MQTTLMWEKFRKRTAKILFFFLVKIPRKGAAAQLNESLGAGYLREWFITDI